MLSPADALKANGVGTQDWLAIAQHMLIGAYITPLAAIGAAVLSTSGVSLAPLVPTINDKTAQQLTLEPHT